MGIADRKSIIQYSKPEVSSVPYQTASKPVVSEQRKFLQGNIIQKGFDVLQSVDFALSGLTSGAIKERERQRAKGGNQTFVNPVQLGQRIWSGIKEVPNAIRDRRDLFQIYNPQTANYDQSAGKLASEKIGFLKDRPLAQSAWTFGASMAIPAPPIGKVFKVAGKGINAAKTAAKATNVVSDASKVASKVEKASDLAKTPSYFHGTGEAFDEVKSMRQLRQSGSKVEPSNLGGNSPFVHLTDNKNVAQGYAKARAYNISGTPDVKEFKVDGKILDFTKGDVYNYTIEERNVFQKIIDELITLSNGRGPDAFIAAELSRIAKEPKMSIDAKLATPSFTDIEASKYFSDILEKYGYVGVKFRDNKIMGGWENTIAVLPQYLKNPQQLAQVAPDVVKVAGIASRPSALAVAGKGILKAEQAMGSVADWTKTQPVVRNLIETFSPYYTNKALGELIEGTKFEATRRISELMRTMRTLSKGLSTTDQQDVFKLIEAGSDFRKTVLKTGTPEQKKLIKIANEVVKLANQTGKEAVKEGLMTAETFAKHKDKYISHVWTSLRAQDAEKSLVPRITAKFFGERKGAKGFVEEFAPAAFRGLGSEMKDIEAAKMYKEIAKQYGIKIKGATEEAMLKMAEKGYRSAYDVAQMRGAKNLYGYMLPPEVHRILKRDLPKNGENLALLMFDKTFNAWKAGKTVWNPAYHIRNVLSNQILSQMSTGKTTVETVIDHVDSVMRFFKNKGNDKFINAAQDAGLIDRVSIGKGFNELLDGAVQLEVNKGFGPKAIWGRASNFVRALQENTEGVSKIAVFKSWVENLAEAGGKSIDQALKDPKIIRKAAQETEKAIFSPYKINQAEKNMLARIIPFYSFTRQVVPFTAETFVRNPGTFLKFPRIKTAVESLSEEVVPDSQRPEWQQGQIQLPVKYDGNYVSFDTSYIYPFGQFGEGDISKGRLPGGLSLNPLIQTPFEIMANKNLYFDKEIATSSLSGIGPDALYTTPKRSGSQLAGHVIRAVEPAPVTVWGRKWLPAAQGKPDYAGRDRSLPMATLDALGIKLVPLRPDEQAKYNRMDDREKMTNIRSDMRKIQRDDRLTPEQKRYWLNELQKEMSKVRE